MGRNNIVKVTSYTPEQISYIRAHVQKMSDKELAKRIGSTPDRVGIYRRRVLGVSKDKRRNFMFIDENGLKMQAMKELEALHYYGYNGIMKESVAERIRFLQEFINK